MKVMLMPLAMAAMFFRTGMRHSVYRKKREPILRRLRGTLCLILGSAGPAIAAATAASLGVILEM